MAQIGHNSQRGGRMYAITCDLDAQTLEESYGSPSWRNAHADIRNALSRHGFSWKQGSVYFGNERVDAVSCVLAVQDLTQQFPWFRPSVRNIRMLRIEEHNDLGPAIERAAGVGANRARRRDN